MVKDVNCVLEEKYKVNISHFFWNELMIRNFTFLKSVKSSTKLVYCLIYSLTRMSIYDVFSLSVNIFVL